MYNILFYFCHNGSDLLHCSYRKKRLCFAMLTTKDRGIIYVCMCSGFLTLFENYKETF